MNGRRETVTFGKYGPAGLSLARARELCIDAKRAISEGRSPAIEKQREKRRLLEAKSFGEFGEKWLTSAPTMADSTRAMRRSIFERELLPKWRARLLTEITPDDLRALCGAIVERGAPATAIHVRDIVKQIYGFAILHGEKIANPADDVGPSSIATFVQKDRSLSPTEIRIMLKLIEKRSGSASHSGAYSNTTVSLPRTLLLRARPTGRVRPSRSIWISMSAMIGRSRCALEADAFRQLRAGQGLADAVAADVGDLAQAVEQAKRLQDGGVDADADIGIARFDLLQGRAGREGAFGHDGHGQPPTTTGV
jgi:hypothetical protein